MIWIAPLLLIALVVGFIVWTHSDEPAPEFDPEESTRAAVELYRIRSRLDVAWTRTELRRESTRIRRLMTEELDDEGEPGDAP